MQIILEGNGFDFARYALAEGITIQREKRVLQRLICLDGGLRESSVTKRKISYRAIELRDSTLAEMSQAVTNPMTLLFTDNDGTVQSADFFITLAGPPASEVSGNTTYYTGFGFDAEEA